MSKYRIVTLREYYVIEERCMFFFWVRISDYQLFKTASDAKSVVEKMLLPKRIIAEY